VPLKTKRTATNLEGRVMPNRILVIEENVAARYAYERALNAAGYHTVGFRSYFDAALDIDTGDAELLVVNIKLPPGTPQGFSVARMAQGHHPGLPVVFVAGSLELAKLADAEDGPVLLKPIDLSLLVNTVRDLLADPPKNQI
jgi:DNA-binding NtrC family response regulator